MATFGLIRWKKIKDMLNTCADGWWYEDKKHRRWIYYGDLEAFKLPTGEHGKRDNHDLQVGQLRGLIRHLGIIECAKKQIEQLR